MSRYATPADIYRLAFPAAGLAAFSSDDQQAALDVASAFADSHLSSQFTLPLTSWSDDLRRAVCCIAAYDLISGRGYNPEADPNLRLRYLDSVDWLERVGRNQAHPQVVDSSPTAAAGRPPRVVSKPSRGF